MKTPFGPMNAGLGEMDQRRLAEAVAVVVGVGLHQALVLMEPAAPVGQRLGLLHQFDAGAPTP